MSELMEGITLNPSTLLLGDSSACQEHRSFLDFSPSQTLYVLWSQWK